MNEITWNPLDPASPLRSRRAQGAALVMAAIFLQLFGIEFTPEDQGVVLTSFNAVLVEIGVVWGLWGTIRASSSARPFVFAFLLLPLTMPLTACAASAWPPSVALGDSEISDCELYQVTTRVDGTVEEIYQNCDLIRGGEVSAHGAGLVRGSVGVVRGAAGAVLGLPVPAPPAAEPEPERRL